MQERVYFEDQDLRVTASDIRCKQLTIRTNSVTSVSIASIRPAKWLPVIVIIPMILLGFVLSQLLALFGHPNPLVFAPFLIILLPFFILSFLRVSRVYLQTSGGPVVLAFKIQFTDPSDTLARFQSIKDSIEQAMRAAQATRIEV